MSWKAILCFCKLQRYKLEAGQRKLKPLNPSNLAVHPSCHSLLPAISRGLLAVTQCAGRDWPASGGCEGQTRAKRFSQGRSRANHISAQTSLTFAAHLTCSPRKVVGLTWSVRERRAHATCASERRARAIRVSERRAHAEKSSLPCAYLGDLLVPREVDCLTWSVLERRGRVKRDSEK